MYSYICWMHLKAQNETCVELVFVMNLSKDSEQQKSPDWKGRWFSTTQKDILFIFQVVEEPSDVINL
jgi:hypothetical protein